MTEKRLNIKLMGKESRYFEGLFPDENEALIISHKDITPEDDFVFCLSYPKIILEPYISLPRVGVFVNHSSDLPKGRGWAPLQWSVLKQLDMITVTLFKAVTAMDAGDWCFKESYPVEIYDTIYTLYEKDREASKRLLQKAVSAYKTGTLVFHKQTGNPEYWPKRTPNDSQLDSQLSIGELWNHISICDNDAYPAFFRWENCIVFVRYIVESIATIKKNTDYRRMAIQLRTDRPLMELWNDIIEEAHKTHLFYFEIVNKKVFLRFTCYEDHTA